jgi:glucosyl-3-phosphoglycerate phosphatase
MDRMDFPELYILRHGETEWNAARRMQGRLDSPLTPRGREQARAQRGILARVGVRADSHAFHVSPQGRAMDTARLVLEGWGVTPTIDPRLSEIDLGAWQGLTMDEIDAHAPGIFETFPGLGWYDHCPGGERLAALRDRAAAVLAGLQGPSVLITHSIFSAAMRTVVLGLPEDAISDMPGGQGVVYHLADGVMTRLDP